LTPCCNALEQALEGGLLVEAGNELVLPLRPLTDVSADAKVGNIVTGEDYDPGEFSLTMAITYCPWCRARLVPRTLDEDEFDPFELEALCDEGD
jgi:hypothetical protein